MPAGASKGTFLCLLRVFAPDADLPGIFVLFFGNDPDFPAAGRPIAWCFARPIVLSRQP
jgi:hypothetical protein